MFSRKGFSPLLVDKSSNEKTKKNKEKEKESNHGQKFLWRRWEDTYDRFVIATSVNAAKPILSTI